MSIVSGNHIFSQSSIVVGNPSVNVVNSTLTIRGNFGSNLNLTTATADLAAFSAQKLEAYLNSVVNVIGDLSINYVMIYVRHS
jgi:hypothetical protein